jgi:hypothetical protein
MGTEVQAKSTPSVAPAISHAPANLLQCKCACGGDSGVSGECEECRKKRLGIPQRSARNSNPWTKVPPIVSEVISSAGSPLDQGSKKFMESRFGHDFSHVRIHTDSQAAASAKAINALAYTVGKHVVFDKGQYAPQSISGRRLMAHEMTHVLQQSQGNLSQSIDHPEDSSEVEAENNAKLIDSTKQLTFTGQRPAISRETTTTVEVIPPTTPNSCGLEQHREIFPAAMQAIQWLETAIASLNAFNTTPAAEGDAARARSALDRHFHSTTADTATQVLGRLTTIRNDISNRATLNVECHDSSDATCGAANAYVTGSLLVFCPIFFDFSPNSQAMSIVHEMAHSLVGGDHITDRAYRSDRIYTMLSTAEALTNAESFGLLVQELGARTVQASTAPRDTLEDCPDDWQPLIRTAIAKAQRWNRNAQTATSDRRPTWLAGWTDLQNTYLGGTSADLLNRAEGVYDRVYSGVRSSIGFECEADGGGRCDRFETYWYEFWSDFHLCPSWRNLGSDDDRTVSMLTGLYGYIGGIGDSENSRRLNYARLARDLNTRFWSL